MDENDPIDDNEFVYRRIHPQFFDAALAMPVQRDAFRPTQNDSTGLSVLRAHFARPAHALPKPEAGKATNYYVARLAVRDVRDLGLTVVPEPVPAGPPGHAVIPELSWAAYQANKLHWKALLLELARLASADIVFQPNAP
jgi:hypothetical protein